MKKKGKIYCIKGRSSECVLCTKDSESVAFEGVVVKSITEEARDVGTYSTLWDSNKFEYSDLDINTIEYPFESMGR